MTERVLSILAGPSRNLPNRRAHELFEDQARARPETIAAVHGSRQLTYGELNARANQVAEPCSSAGSRAKASSASRPSGTWTG